eukprot:5722563-Amphidinium_carterae.1
MLLNHQTGEELGLRVGLGSISWKVAVREAMMPGLNGMASPLSPPPAQVALKTCRMSRGFFCSLPTLRLGSRSARVQSPYSGSSNRCL